MPGDQFNASELNGILRIATSAGTSGCFINIRQPSKLPPPACNISADTYADILWDVSFAALLPGVERVELVPKAHWSPKAVNDSASVITGVLFDADFSSTYADITPRRVGLVPNFLGPFLIDRLGIGHRWDLLYSPPALSLHKLVFLKIIFPLVVLHLCALVLRLFPRVPLGPELRVIYELLAKVTLMLFRSYLVTVFNRPPSMPKIQSDVDLVEVIERGKAKLVVESESYLQLIRASPSKLMRRLTKALERNPPVKVDGFGASVRASLDPKRKLVTVDTHSYLTSAYRTLTCHPSITKMESISWIPHGSFTRFDTRTLPKTPRDLVLALGSAERQKRGSFPKRCEEHSVANDVSLDQISILFTIYLFVLCFACLCFTFEWLYRRQIRIV